MNLADLFEQQCQISLSLREGSLGLVCIYCSFHLPLLLFIYLPPPPTSLCFCREEMRKEFSLLRLLSRAYNGHIFSYSSRDFVLC